MDDNTENFYDQLKKILLNYPIIRWISKENDTVLASEKIEAIDLSFFEVLFRFPRILLLGDSTLDSILARVELRQAKYYANNVTSWQQLFFLFNDQAPLVLLRKKRQEPYCYTQYILVRKGMRFMGIKTIVIDHDA